MHAAQTKLNAAWDLPTVKGQNHCQALGTLAQGEQREGNTKGWGIRPPPPAKTN